MLRLEFLQALRQPELFHFVVLLLVDREIVAGLLQKLAEYVRDERLVPVKLRPIVLASHVVQCIAHFVDRLEGSSLQLASDWLRLLLEVLACLRSAQVKQVTLHVLVFFTQLIAEL